MDAPERSDRGRDAGTNQRTSISSNSAVCIVVGAVLATAVAVGAFIFRRSPPQQQPSSSLDPITPAAGMARDSSMAYYRRSRSPSSRLPVL